MGVLVSCSAAAEAFWARVSRVHIGVGESAERCENIWDTRAVRTDEFSCPCCLQHLPFTLQYISTSASAPSTVVTSEHNPHRHVAKAPCSGQLDALLQVTDIAAPLARRNRSRMLRR